MTIIIITTAFEQEYKLADQNWPDWEPRAQGERKNICNLHQEKLTAIEMRNLNDLERL